MHFRPRLDIIEIMGQLWKDTREKTKARKPKTMKRPVSEKERL